MQTDMEVLEHTVKQLREAQDICRQRLDKHQCLAPGELGTLSAIVTCARINLDSIVKYAQQIQD